jgi:hypothetical protein
MSEHPKMKRSGGRPRLDNPRTSGVTVRLTADERFRLEVMAGKGRIGELMRSSALGSKATLARSVPEINRAAWVELSRTASNLNQLAHRYNSGKSVDPYEIAVALDECCKLLKDVRHGLMTGESIPQKDQDVIDGGR